MTWILNYTALDYANKVSEHHKSWPISQVFHEAATHITVVAYKSRASASDIIVTVGGFRYQ